MNNIYDVILNFLNNYYEVYEWKNTDDIINVRKIPFFKVDDNTYLSYKENKVKIKKETLDTIKYNCLMYGDEDINDIMCLITNGKTAMGVVFDLEGNVIKKSSMLFDEEEEVILESRNLEEMKISFIVNEKQINKSRVETEKKEMLLEFLNNISDKMILKYIYYDYFLVECNDINKIKTDLLNEINDTNNLLKLYEVVSLFSKCH